MAKILICVPSMDMVAAGFAQSLAMLQKGGNETAVMFQVGSLIYDARNKLAKEAIKMGADYTMWFDSDMVFPPDTMFRLSEAIDKGHDFATGLYFTRKPPIKPVIYKSLWWDNKDGLNVGAENDYDYKEGLIEIAGAGFGCCMTTVDLLKRVGDRFGSPFMPLQGFGEDLSFCWRAIMVGAKMGCDTSIKCGHVGYQEFSETDYDKGEFLNATD